jgi:hypothetical protein
MAVSALYTTSVAKKTTSSTITSVVVSTGDALYVVLDHNQKTGGAGKYASTVVWDVATANESLALVGTGQAQNGKACVEIWKLAAPTAKTATVTITWVDNNANWNGDVSTAIVVSGHDTGTPDDGWNTNSGTGTAATIAIATESGDFTVGSASSTIQALTENGDGTEQWNDSTNACKGAGSDFTAVDAQSDHSWSLTSAEWVTAGININADAGGSGAMQGAANITFTDAAVLSGKGKLVGQSNLVLTDAAILNGKGQLEGTANVVFSDAAVVSGKGKLEGQGNIAITDAGVLKGSGKLVAVSNITFTNQAVLTGKGVLAGVVNVTFSTLATLADAVGGAMQALATISFTTNAVVKGVGKLVGVSNITSSTTGIVSGTGGLIGESNPAFSTNSILRAEGLFQGISNIVFSTTAKLTVVGEIVIEKMKKILSYYYT